MRETTTRDPRDTVTNTPIDPAGMYRAVEEIDEWVEMARRAAERAEEGARQVRRDLERLDATRRRSRLWPLVGTVARRVGMVVGLALLILVAWAVWTWAW